MQPTAGPDCFSQSAPDQHTSQADKKELIAWIASKYSVPVTWNRARVGVREQEGSLHTHDLGMGDQIASHALYLAVEQILSKAPCRDFVHQVLVGGGNDADVCLAFAGGADRSESPLLQHSQQPYLTVQRQFSELVEK